MKGSIKKNAYKKRNKTQRKVKAFDVKKKYGETIRDKQIARRKEEKMNFPLRDKKITSSEEIFKIAGEEFDKMLIRKNTPVLARLFSKDNMERFDKLPKDEKSYTQYHELLKKELEKTSKSKYAPNQDYYTYTNYGWLKEQTQKLKKDPKYYVEIDDFRMKQDDVYRELIGKLKEFIKEEPKTKKARGVEAIYKCIMNNTKEKAYEAVRKIKNDVEDITNNKTVTDMLVFLNRDEVMSWQSPIVWYVMPDEKDVKTYRSHLSPPQLGIYDYFVYIEDPKDSPKTKQFKSTFKKKYLEFIRNVFKICLPKEYKDYDPMDVWNVECQLLDAMGCIKVKKEDPNYYNVLTKKQIEEEYGLNWTEFCIKQGYSKDKIPNKIIV